MNEQENRDSVIIPLKEQPEHFKEVLQKTALWLALFIAAVFLISPFIQIIVRIFDMSGKPDIAWGTDQKFDWYYGQTMYHRMIDVIHFLTLLAAVVLYIYAAYSLFERRKELKVKQVVTIFLPFLIFVVFCINIIVVTLIRGPEPFDIWGHYYMYESVYSYMRYPLVYFVAGLFISSPKLKKILLNVFMLTALIHNILAIIFYLGGKVPFFFKDEDMLTGVFLQYNHTGYYIVVTVITASMLFMYEKNIWLALFDCVCASVGMVAMIFNTSRGSFLSIWVTLLLFSVYNFFVADRKTAPADKKLSFIKRKPNFCRSLIIPCIFFVILIALSFNYNTVLSRFFTIFVDMKNVLTDPLGADDAGTRRWWLWKNTAYYLFTLHPFLGFGVEGLLKLGVETPHNELLQYAAFFGIQSAVMYASSVAIILKRTFSRLRTLSPMTVVCLFTTIAYLVGSCFGVMIYYTTPYVYIFLGLTYSEYIKEKLSPQTVAD